MDPYRAGGPCQHARAAAGALAEADARCRAAKDEERKAAFDAYRKAFEAYARAQEECRRERMQSRR